MNKARRKDLEKALALLEEAKGWVEGAAVGEREYVDNMPENMQGGEKYDTAADMADALENGVEALDDLIEAIGNAVA